MKSEDVMQTNPLPQTVLQALGQEAAGDLINWLEERFASVGLSSGVQISAFVARQKVNVLLLEQVSNLFLADEPVLIQDKDHHWVWRVPVDLIYPSKGRVGRVGEVDVDARYGEVRYSETLLAKMTTKAQQLAGQISQQA
jgi:hypothetical protein